MTVDRTSVRRALLLETGATATEAAELLAYNESKFIAPAIRPEFPLPDEPFADAWRVYAEETAPAGSIQPLCRYLVQLSFPIETGMSAREDYQAATKKGKRPVSPIDGGVKLHAPERCRLSMHPSAAGHVPVLILEDRRDFETFVRAFSRKNEPFPIPTSMGAAMIAGCNNWHRIDMLREQFLASGGTLAGWGDEFARIKRMPELYQDRFILLSSGPYSGVEAHALELDPEQWLQLSRAIRLEHECAHYFTKRVFQSMQNNLLDELIADYAGIAVASGRFRGDWLLHFLGLESYPLYREGGRLENYRGTPPLSDGAFRLLFQLVYRAAINMESFDSAARERTDEFCLAAALMALATMTLEEIGSPAAPSQLTNAYCNGARRSRAALAAC